MFLSATTVSLQPCLFRTDADRMNGDLGGEIEARTHADVQASAARMQLRDVRQSVALLCCRRKRKSRRPPRTLADSERPFAIERGEHSGDVGTRKVRSALRAGKI